MTVTYEPILLGGARLATIIAGLVTIDEQDIATIEWSRSTRHHDGNYGPGITVHCQDAPQRRRIVDAFHLDGPLTIYGDDVQCASNDGIYHGTRVNVYSRADDIDHAAHQDNLLLA